jgi:hypothetical protein
MLKIDIGSGQLHNRIWKRNIYCSIKRRKENILMAKHHKENYHDDQEELKEGISFKHDKDGLTIYITIYNNNNLANQGGKAGTKQAAETGGQINGQGQNANQGGQIAKKGGQNANQEGQIAKNGGENDLVEKNKTKTKTENETNTDEL